MGVGAAFSTKFRKVMALVGSDREGERHAAANQAWKMCDENRISFLEAMEGSFGTSNDDALRDKIEELEEDNRKLAEAVNALMAKQQTVPEDAGHQLLERLWSSAQVRLGVVFAVTMVSFWLLARLDRWWGEETGFTTFIQWAVRTLGLLDVLFLAWCWAGAEFFRSGIGVTALKSIPVAGCIYLCVTLFQGPRDVIGAAVVVGIAALLTISNLCRWLVHQLAHSNDEIFALLRSWFA